MHPYLSLPSTPKHRPDTPAGRRRAEEAFLRRHGGAGPRLIARLLGAGGRGR